MREFDSYMNVENVVYAPTKPTAMASRVVSETMTRLPMVVRNHSAEDRGDEEPQDRTDKSRRADGQVLDHYLHQLALMRFDPNKKPRPASRQSGFVKIAPATGSRQQELSSAQTGSGSGELHRP
jgi:hypothetical protein